MPFIFVCSQCGSTLYEEGSPVLQDGSYKSPTYFETVLMIIGTTCPFCGHKLRVPPSNVEVYAPRMANNPTRAGQTRGARHRPKRLSRMIKSSSAKDI